mgnify:CR=1 FL=1
MAGTRPIVGITMGDPAGNGPELTVKALADAALYERCRPLVVGDAKMIEQAKGFVTKVWNASRFVLMNLDGYVPGAPKAETPEDAWMLSRLARIVDEYVGVRPDLSGRVDRLPRRAAVEGAFEDEPVSVPARRAA